MSCPGRIVRERLDPIVVPGGISSHVHTISGGSGFSANMTYDDARAAKCSSCEIKVRPIDQPPPSPSYKSNYWTPTLMAHLKNGGFTPVPVAGDPSDTNGGMTVYYLQRPANTSDKLTAFPPGFRMIAGDPFKRSFDGTQASKAISFACLGTATAETNGFPPYACPGGLRAQVFFPSCWNGKDLDTPDHKSHMSYPISETYNSSPCPADFPIHFTSLFYEVLYDTARFQDEWVNGKHPFVFANGDPTGYGFHGDFVNGWDVPELQKAIDTCNDDSGAVEKCGAVTMYTSQQCNACKIPTTVKEETGGMLEKLPGCNPITPGPEPAPHVPCKEDTVALGRWKSNYIDLTNKGWAYVGCGTDSVADRAFPAPNDWTYSANMTVENCIEHCTSSSQSEAFTYVALEYGNECFCGKELEGKYAPVDEIMGSCTMKCAGDAGQICGAASATSIYQKCEEGGACENNEIGGKADAKSGERRSARLNWVNNGMKCRGSVGNHAPCLSISFGIYQTLSTKDSGHGVSFTLAFSGGTAGSS
ncbi:WSC-domain-containing protein [Plenodomus tracheiphilus IPT5]|uniref:WSC-domain-containing protein n=1 Tax=Plenodomus tracheiphilus IPT5 TaxID=1408161 RepID=A0A6A7AQM5_9PLEO|nr:WSC-domain-containing protein [Plenodomus tracheiphilus IPT5]